MSTHSIVIADDEPLARERIRTFLEEHPEYKVVAECEDGIQTLDAIVSHHPDIVFLDIRMPGLDGLEVIDALTKTGTSSPAIVFVTAYDEYAVSAFDMSATDYLRKPYDRERFERALARAESQTGKARTEIDPALRSFLETLRREKGFPPRFLIRGQQGLYFVRTEDIDWVDAQGNYVRLHAGKKTHLLRDTMKTFEQKLDPRIFVRVNRSVIVNIDHIERAETYGHGEYLIVLRDGSSVTSSRAYGARLHELLR